MQCVDAFAMNVWKKRGTNLKNEGLGARGLAVHLMWSPGVFTALDRTNHSSPIVFMRTPTNGGTGGWFAGQSKAS